MKNLVDRKQYCKSEKVAHHTSCGKRCLGKHLQFFHSFTMGESVALWFGAQIIYGTLQCFQREYNVEHLLRPVFVAGTKIYFTNYSHVSVFETLILLPRINVVRFLIGMWWNEVLTICRQIFISDNTYIDYRVIFLFHQKLFNYLCCLELGSRKSIIEDTFLPHLYFVCLTNEPVSVLFLRIFQFLC